MMNEPKLIILSSGGKDHCELTYDEIKSSHRDANDPIFIMEWKTACLYFLKFTDNLGVCKIDLEDLFNGNTFDQVRTVTVNLLFTALVKSPAKFESVPRPYLEGSFLYFNAMLQALELAIDNEKNETALYQFECFVIEEMIEAAYDNISYDDAFDRVLNCLPPISDYTRLSEKGKKEHLWIFDRMLKDTRYCSTSYYQQKIESFIDEIS